MQQVATDTKPELMASMILRDSNILPPGSFAAGLSSGSVGVASHDGHPWT